MSVKLFSTRFPRISPVPARDCDSCPENYAKGFRDGVCHASGQALDWRIKILSECLAQIRIIREERSHKAKRLTEEITQMCYDTIAHVFPLIHTRYPREFVVDCVRENLPNVDNQEVSIHVNSSIVADLLDDFPKFTVIGDDSLEIGDCRIKIGGGEISCFANRILDEIARIFSVENRNSDQEE